MTDPINDAAEVIKKAHIHDLMEHFKEPGQVSYTQEGIGKVMALYQIAQVYDKEDPLGWIYDFDKTNPHNLEVGTEDTRVGTVLVMAELWHTQRQKSDRQIKKSVGAIRRDFEI